MGIRFARAADASSQTSKRLRLEDFVTDPKRIKSFKTGVAVMKSRKPSDPRSWFFQGAIHGYTEDLYQQALVNDPGVASVAKDPRLWNQCPHYDALKLASANFLIWHRAYVYYFERILRDAAQDADLCLPYWNYTDPNQRMFPALFNKSSETDDNPLFSPQREQAFTAGLYKLSDAAVSTDAAFKQVQFFGAMSSDGFAGAADDLEPDSQGRIERSPHNNVHFAVGGFILDASGQNGTGGLMADVPTAAFDPIFWVHHANIDRLWSVWDEMDGRTWGQAPTPAWFQEKPWWFYDYTGKDPLNLERGYYIQPRNFNLAFDSDQGKPRLSDKLPSPPNTRPIELSLLSKNLISTTIFHVPDLSFKAQQIGASSKILKLSSQTPTSLNVQVAQDVLGHGTIVQTLTNIPTNKKRFILLKLEGVDYKSTPLFLYDVYLNLPVGISPNRDDPHYVGVLSLFGVKHHMAGGMHHTHSNIFDLSRIVDGQDISVSNIELTFVPVPLLVPVEANGKANAPLTSEPEVTVNIVKILAVESVL